MTPRTPDEERALAARIKADNAARIAKGRAMSDAAVNTPAGTIVDTHAGTVEFRLGHIASLADLSAVLQWANRHGSANVTATFTWAPPAPDQR